MPFRSEAQRRYMHANHPEIAKEFESETPAGAKLPERIHPKKDARKQFESKTKRRLTKVFGTK